jgi:hypothetical protein
VYKWILNHAEPDERKAKLICQKMLEKEIMSSVENKTFFAQEDIYRMQMDRDDIADNTLKRWKQEVRDPITCSSELVE